VRTLCTSCSDAYWQVGHPLSRRSSAWQSRPAGAVLFLGQHLGIWRGLLRTSSQRGVGVLRGLGQQQAAPEEPELGAPRVARRSSWAVSYSGVAPASRVGLALVMSPALGVQHGSLRDATGGSESVGCGHDSPTETAEKPRQLGGSFRPLERPLHTPDAHAPAGCPSGHPRSLCRSHLEDWRTGGLEDWRTWTLPCENVLRIAFGRQEHMRLRPTEPIVKVA